MVEDRDFLQVICANPDDDGPRLVYADYLDEKGDPANAARAEFIRVQCALETLAPTDPSFAMLHGRERKLLEEHWRTWLRPACQALGEALPVGSTAPKGYDLVWLNRTGRQHAIEQSAEHEPPFFRLGQFRRGFLSHVALLAKTHRGPNYVARLFEKTPVNGLSLMTYPWTSIREIMRAIPADRLRTLILIDTIPDEAQAGREEQLLGGLTELSFWSVQQPAAAITGLIGAAGPSRLKRLRFTYCGVTVNALWKIRSLLNGIERLDMIGCRTEEFDTERLIPILRSVFPKLVHLDLRNGPNSSNLMDGTREVLCDSSWSDAIPRESSGAP